MSASLDTQSEYGSLRPRNIRLYLRMNGWQRTEAGEDGPSIWQLPASRGTFELIAPSSADARDFPERVAELVRTLSIAEDRTPAEVIRDLSTLSFDIQYIRHEYASPRGTAPLRDTAAAYSALQGVYSAVTASLEEPRPVLPYRKPAQAANLMRRVLAGPTSPGSYVISVWTPIPPRLTPEEDSVLFELEDEPYERRATVHLHTALRATRTAIRETRDSMTGIDTFIERAPEGVSANLCESLAALAGEDETGFDVRFSWATERPMSVDESTIHFDAESIPVLTEAARQIRARLPEDDVRIRGNVIRLHREGRERGAGEVTIAGIVTGDPIEKMRRVSVSLDESDYERAIVAHHDYADVEVVGSLIQRGTRTYLTQARGFLVQPPPDEIEGVSGDSPA